MRAVKRVHNSRCGPPRGPKRASHKRFALMIGCGSMVLAAAISATLAADQSSTPTPPPRRTTPAAAQTPARELVATYCVSCHNQRLKTANLMLDTVDADQVS